MGYDTHLYFCGDPDLPGEETIDGGKLHYHRWCQWISAQHRGGVYDGEEGKIRDWNASLPPSLIDNVIAPSAAAGKSVILLGEEWHTSWSMGLISNSLYIRGLRDRVARGTIVNTVYLLAINGLTIVQGLLVRRPDIALSVSYTTRSPRPPAQRRGRR